MVALDLKTNGETVSERPLRVLIAASLVQWWAVVIDLGRAEERKAETHKRRPDQAPHRSEVVDQFS